MDVCKHVHCKDDSNKDAYKYWKLNMVNCNFFKSIISHMIKLTKPSISSYSQNMLTWNVIPPEHPIHPSLDIQMLLFNYCYKKFQ